MEPEQPPLRAADSSPSPREEVVPGPQDPNSPTSTVAVPSSTPLPAIATPSVEVENTDSQVQLQSKLLTKALTPNAALLKFQGSANLTVEQVLSREDVRQFDPRHTSPG